MKIEENIQLKIMVMIRECRDFGFSKERTRLLINEKLSLNLCIKSLNHYTYKAFRGENRIKLDEDNEKMERWNMETVKKVNEPEEIAERMFALTKNPDLNSDFIPNYLDSGKYDPEN